jgi:apolipoprotein N-acyltransferase
LVVGGAESATAGPGATAPRPEVGALRSPGERTKRLDRLRPLALAAAGGVAFALGSPPTDLYPLLLLGLALLAASLDGAPSEGRAFGRGVAWGTAVGIVGLRFVPPVILRFTSLGPAPAVLALVLLAAAQSLVWGVGAAVARALHRRLGAPLELAFAAGVFVALSLPTVFAWSPAGLASPWPSLVQLADLVGERGVSAIFAVVAALVARALLAIPRGAAASPAPISARLRPVLVPLVAAAAVLAALAVHGAGRIRSIERASAALPTITVGLVDASVGANERWEPENHGAILRSLRRLTQQSETQGAELSIWPEAAYPFTLGHEVRRAPSSGPRALLADGVHGPLLFGLITEAPPLEVAPGVVERDSWNSASLLLPDGTLSAPYDKLELLWFGETIPGERYLPWLRRTFQRSGGLVPGDRPRALELPRDGRAAVRMAVLNCYEDTLSGVGLRQARELAPNLLVNVTNDAWFFGTAEPELHARLGAMRAIELRRDLVRAVNLGVASWIDASGRARARYDGAEPGVLMATPAVREGEPTLYARLGDAPAALLLSLGCAASARRSRRRPARAS